MTLRGPLCQRVRLRAAALAVIVALAGCAYAAAGRESAILGRWHRLAEPNLDDPFQTLASEYIEFAPNGVLVSLLFDRGPGRFWTATTGEYSVSGADQITISGRCWQGWRSYACSRTYGFTLKEDRLIIFDHKHQERRLEFERIVTASTDLPPTLAPPVPSATARKATLAVSPAVPTETAVPDLSSLRDAWRLYVNTSLGVSFEVPAAYDMDPFQSWGCGVRASGNQIIFGTDNSLTVASAGGLDLAEYVDRYVQQQGSGFDTGQRETISSNAGRQGVLIEYFLRGVNHSGVVAFFERDDSVYVFRVRLSLACSMQELGLISPGPFYHAVETFQFVP